MITGEKMETKSKVRTPKQERSIQKKQSIRSTSLELFCKNGYHQTTTNQIAKEARISVGSLYEYYPNKEAILIEILNDYFEQFLNHEESITLLFTTEIHTEDKGHWLKTLINNLIASHTSSLSFNRELQYLYFSIPQVADICNKQKAQMRQIIYNSLLSIKDELIVTDLEAATIIFMDLLDKIIDRITLYPLPIENERIIDQGIHAICLFLFGKTY
ncbi:MAG: TetR/AcrR family transcriptional regulator [bacterium]|nr:TetR/AcrR family transcriptional regulator [bacterium]